MLPTNYRFELFQRKSKAYGNAYTRFRRGLISFEEMTELCDKIEQACTALINAWDALTKMEEAYASMVEDKR